jgi:hypothetical protein
LQLPEIVSILALVVAAVAITGLALVYRSLQRYRRNQHVIMGSRGSVDIVEHVSAVDDKLTNMRLALEDLTLAARDHDVRIDGSLSRVGIVRFDAYQDLGGRQSTAVAFLNAASNGVVITTVVSRDFARMYVKLVRDGQGDIPLAPEEAEAVNQARGSSPFTIRPRVEGISREDSDERDELDSTAETAPMAAGLPGPRGDDDREVDRENRMRRRKGLPLVEGKVPVSAGGWDAPETPTPPGASLAEEFVRQRKQRLEKTEEPEDEPELEADDDADHEPEYDDDWSSAYADDEGDPRGL